MGSEMNQHDSPDNPMVLLRRLHRWRMAFFGLVILMAGMLSGAAVALLVVGHIGRQGTPPPLGVVKGMLAQLGPRLNLSAEQRDRMEPILLRHMQRLEQIGDDGRTAIVEELRTLDEEMATVLNEGQMRQWEQLLQGLPGQIRHAPGGFGPGLGPGPGGGRGMGRGRFGAGRSGQGPFRVSPNTPPVPEANAVPSR
jgi:hypothetical protein